MKRLITTGLVAAAALALPACSGNNAADNAGAANETVLVNDEGALGTDNFSATDTLGTDNATIVDNAVDANVGDAALNGTTTGNTL